MANASRWSLSTRQGILVGVLITGGLFVVCCGTGMSNIPIAALGIAVGVAVAVLVRRLVAAARAGQSLPQGST